ncbi:HAMP domain-containing protein [Microvirga tunisiensis]|uniref:histidine kinase n=1 Tax=Pannonibacter tanglangensis TaxID=2750084 RepID=A0A7X5F3L3_9HYPH|nr:HAMP domain-containing sensor histidine kinase [Pannonibacter sp. XCT-53]NBN79162.1 HAMP domain-containing protein [Pannonibacter sp. XCT-53]
MRQDAADRFAPLSPGQGTGEGPEPDLTADLKSGLTDGLTDGLTAGPDGGPEPRARSDAADGPRADLVQAQRRISGLSGKLLLLTVLFVMLSEVFIFVPSIANYRNTWLNDRLTTAGVAASVLTETNTIAPRLQEELLRTTGALAIALVEGQRRSLIAMSALPQDIDMIIDMRAVSPMNAIASSFAVLLSPGEGLMRVIGAGPMAGGGRGIEQVDIVLPIRLLREDMLAFSGRILALSLFISGLTATLVYITLRALFVRPLQRLTRAMQAFAEAPQDATLLLPPSTRADEIGDAERRFVDMQQTLARTLHQKQRLADLGLAVSKINHDLRNLLASAQLFIERLENVPDPTVRRLAPKILSTLDRAAAYTQAVLAYGKAQEATPSRRLVRLARVVTDVGELLALAERADIAFEVEVDEALEIDADPEQLFRVLLNLLRNALQALEGETDEAVIRRIAVRAVRRDGLVTIRVSDTGPGIPPAIRNNLFRAFQSAARSGGTGLGLAIAAELTRAHGGTIALEDRGAGATFRLDWPDRPSGRASDRLT